MPVLWYRDPADGVLKPYVPPQEDFVKKSGDTMTGNLKIARGAEAGAVFGGGYTGLQVPPLDAGGVGGQAILMGNGASDTLHLIGGSIAGSEGVVRIRPGGVASGTGTKDVQIDSTGLTVPGTSTYVDKPPFARYTASSRNIPLSVWTQFTAVQIIDQDNGTFSGGSNMTVPAPGYYVVNMRILTSVAGRVIGSTANSGDGNHGNTANYHFDARGAAASDWVSGSRTVWIDSYIQFWAYCTPTSNCTLQADVIRIGGT